MDLLKNSVGASCRLEALLQDVAPSTEPVTQDQQRRIDKRCKQIMVDAEAIVKSQSTLLPSELFNHAIPVGDSTLALKEAATESLPCSNNSPVGNQSSSTEDTFRIDSERLPDSAATDVASRANKITLQRKKHSVIRGPQGKLEKD